MASGTTFVTVIRLLAGAGLVAAALFPAWPTATAGAPSAMRPERPIDITAVGESLFFIGWDANGWALWTSDGSRQGTEMVRDLHPNSNRSVRRLDDITALGNTAYFVADTAAGRELWKSDGTEEGTVIVKDINPGEGWAWPFDFLPFGDVMYFTATDGDHGSELWKTDGTESGTVMVTNIKHGNPRGLTIMNDAVFFGVGDTLWTSDGTRPGSHPIISVGKDDDIHPHLTEIGGLLYFSDGYFGDPWRSDGTAEGTFRLRNLVNDGISYFKEMDGKAVFISYHADESKHKFWKTDGTRLGTKVLHKGVGDLDDYNYLASVRGRTLFPGHDHHRGAELWKTNGTRRGTKRLVDIRRGRKDSHPHAFFKVGPTVYFTASDGRGVELYKTDGTRKGTTIVKDINPAPGGIHSFPLDETSLGETLYFSATDGEHPRELWKTDGTRTRRVMGPWE